MANANNDIQKILLEAIIDNRPDGVKSLEFLCSPDKAEQIRDYMSRMGVAPMESEDGFLLTFKVGDPLFVHNQLHKMFFSS